MIDWEKIEQSKRAMRKKLAARPIAEKLAVLDILRERTLALRDANSPPACGGASADPARGLDQESS